MRTRYRHLATIRRSPACVAVVARAVVAVALMATAHTAPAWTQSASAGPVPPAALSRSDTVELTGEAVRAEVAPGLVAILAPDLPDEARRVIVAAMSDLAEAVAFNPAGPVEIAVGWKAMESLGVGGPVIVEVRGRPHPAALADTLFGGRHAADGIDGFVQMSSSQPWYFGLDGEVPADRYDFGSAFAHELIHALGFTMHAEEDDGGRLTLTGTTPQFDSLLSSGGRPLTDLTPTEQDRAFRDDEIWIDVGGGRLLPLHAGAGRGTSHFGYALSVADDQPGALMYAGRTKGIAPEIDAPVLGVLAQLGYPVRFAPSPPGDVRVSLAGGDLAIRWSVDLGPGSTTPVAYRITLLHQGRSQTALVVPGGAARSSVELQRPVDTLVITAVSYSGVESPAVRVVLPQTMAAATTLTELVSAVDYDPRHGEVLRLYRAFFDRDPDLAGAKYWVAIHTRGWSLDAIAGAFTRSPEFTRRYGTLGDRAFLEQIYRNVLGRDYDQAGFEYWLGRLEAGAVRGAVVRWIASAPEFVAAYPYR